MRKNNVIMMVICVLSVSLSLQAGSIYTIGRSLVDNCQDLSKPSRMSGAYIRTNVLGESHVITLASDGGYRFVEYAFQRRLTDTNSYYVDVSMSDYLEGGDTGIEISYSFDGKKWEVIASDVTPVGPWEDYSERFVLPSDVKKIFVRIGGQDEKGGRAHLGYLREVTIKFTNVSDSGKSKSIEPKYDIIVRDVHSGRKWKLENWLDNEVRPKDSPFYYRLQESKKDGLRKYSLVLEGLVGLRELEVCFQANWSEEQSKRLNLWMPIGNNPWQADSEKARIGVYRQNIFVPLITGYEKGGDGISIMSGPENLIPAMSLSTKKSAATIRIYHLGLRPNRKIKLNFYVGKHQGGIRPALGWMYKHWPAYFTCNSASVRKYEGAMLLGGAKDEKQLKQWVDMGFRWSETEVFTTKIHSYGWWMPVEGISTPDMDKVKKFKDYTSMAEKLGFGVFMYCQTTETNPKLAEKGELRKSISRYPTGDVHMLGWRGSYVWMTPTEGGPWFSHALNQAKQLVTTFPSGAGLFIDNNLSKGLSFGQDDGISCSSVEHYWGRDKTIIPKWEVKANKMKTGSGGEYPMLCAQSSIGQASWLGEVYRQCRQIQPDFGLWSNFCGDIAKARYLGGVLLESISRIEGEKYLTLNRPLVGLAYYFRKKTKEEKIKKSEKDLKTCWINGAFWGTNAGEIRTVDSKMLRKYLKMMQVLKGRKWVFEAEPVSVDNKDVEWNIFELPGGKYLVTLVNIKGRYNRTSSKNVEIKVRLPDILKRGITVIIRRVEDSKWQKVNEEDVNVNNGCVIVRFRRFISSGGLLIGSKK